MDKAEIKKIKKQMEDAIKCRLGLDEKVRCPRLKKMAEYIDAVFPDFTTQIIPWSESKDRKIGRLRSPGKTYEGHKLYVRSVATDNIVFEHTTTETYRVNADVARYILNRLHKGIANDN